MPNRGAHADDAALADYLAARHDAGAAPTSIGMTVAAVKAAARLSGQPSPAGPKTARVLAGIRREGRGRGRGQAKGLQWSAADTVAAVAANNGKGKIAGLRDAALVALASDALLRVSEVVAVQVEDIAAEADGSGRLTVHRSKTDQEGRGVVLYLGEATMRRIAVWREAADIHAGPLFLRVRRFDHIEDSAITDRAPPGRSSRRARPKPGSRAACPATACGSARRNRSPPQAPVWSSFNRRGDGTAPRCPPTMHAGSSPRAAPSPASATARASDVRSNQGGCTMRAIDRLHAESGENDFRPAREA